MERSGMVHPEHSKNSVLTECYSNLRIDGQVLWHFRLLNYRSLIVLWTNRAKRKKNYPPPLILYIPLSTLYIKQLRYRIVWKGDDRRRVIHFEALFIYKTSDSYGFTKLTAVRTINVEHTYGGIFCHHLSDNYVDLSDLYVDSSGIYVDLSEKYTNK